MVHRILWPKGMNGLKIRSSTSLLVQSTLPHQAPAQLPPPTPETATQNDASAHSPPPSMTSCACSLGQCDRDHHAGVQARVSAGALALGSGGEWSLARGLGVGVELRKVSLTVSLPLSHCLSLTVSQTVYPPPSLSLSLWTHDARVDVLGVAQQRGAGALARDRLGRAAAVEVHAVRSPGRAIPS
jgi:hypothetical protein